MNSTYQSQLKPFLWATWAWLILAGLTLTAFTEPQIRTSVVMWFSIFWLLCASDLAVIAGLVLSLVSWSDSMDKVRLGLRVGILVLLKMFFLMIFGVILFRKNGIPQSSLLVGLGTLIAVPLLGGMLWTFQGTHRDNT